jgi:putative hemolysin
VNTLYFLILVVCLVVSFFLSGMEAGVFALSRFRIRRLIREGNARARLLYQHLENTEEFLWTIFVGNTLANFVAAALTVLVLHVWLGAHHRWFWAIFIPSGLLFYAVCDLLPKMLFRLYPNRLCLIFLRPFRWVHYSLRPVVWLMAGISALVLRQAGRTRAAAGLFGSRDDLRLVMQESAQALTSEERGMINRVLDLQTLTVGRVMAPLSKVVSVTRQTPVSEVLKLCASHGVTRLPVWQGEGDQQRVAGFLNLRSLLYEAKLDLNKTAGDYLKPALYLDEGRRLEDALHQLQHSGQRLAIVLDRARKEVGLVSLQDILKAVFGEFKL